MSKAKKLNSEAIHLEEKKMKKILTILLAALLVMAMAATSFAAEEEAPEITPADIELYKEYKLEGGEAAPAEELTFTVTLKSGVEDGVKDNVLPTVETENKITTTGDEKTTFVIKFPTYLKTGVYTYEITETKGTTLGVTYDDEPITVVVTITNINADGTADEFGSDIAVHKGDEKIDGPDTEYVATAAAFENTYGQGELTVTKEVSGNLASNTKKFTIHVTFTGENAKSEITYTVAGGAEQTTDGLVKDGEVTVDIELSNDQSAVFTNIPAGVTYTVEEDAKHAVGADNPETAVEGYTVTYDTSNGDGEIKAKDEDAVIVKNEKKTEIDTGIFVDSLPYVVIAVGVIAAIGVMVIRKRREMEG